MAAKKATKKKKIWSVQSLISKHEDLQEDFEALETELKEVKAERDRWVKRVKLLEQRNNAASDLLRGEPFTPIQLRPIKHGYDSDGDEYLSMSIEKAESIRGARRVELALQPRVGLTPAQFATLSFVRRQGYEEGHRSIPNPFLLMLEKNGLVERDPTSRGKNTHWRITEAGVDHVERVMPTLKSRE